MQFFVGATNPDHPCSHLHNPRITSSRLRNTPASSFTTLLSSIPPTPLNRNNNAWIHQQSVSTYLESAPQNSLLGESPPQTSGDELLLSRANRVHLARLRCGHHPSIPAYEHRIRPDLDPSCRWCRGDPETVLHLFEECPNLAGTGVQQTSHQLGTYGTPLHPPSVS